jgi:hypothetical protein
MKKLTTVLTMLLVLSICLVAAAPVTFAADQGQPGTNPNTPEPRDAPITWTPQSLFIPIGPGETDVQHVSFTSQVAIQGASLTVSFPLNRYVTVSPQGPFDLTAGQTKAVDVMTTIPANVAATDGEGGGWLPPIVGLVQVRAGGQEYNWPLVVTVMRVARPPAIRWTPPEVKLFVDPSAATGTTPPSAQASVTFTTSEAIAGARLRATAPLNRFLDLSQTGPIDLVPGTTYPVMLTAHLSADDSEAIASGALQQEGVAIDNSDSGEARIIVSGWVEVYDAQRVYQRTLPVVITFGPLHIPPVVAWRPPVVTLRLTPGQIAVDRVVTVTSNITIENPTLRVTGAIAPYVTATFTPAVTRILPRTPVPVTLHITSPTTAPVNRPVAGEVSVVDGSGHVLKFPLKLALLWHRTTSTSSTQ